MKIEKFINEFENGDETKKAELVAKRVTNKYIPFEIKVAEAKKIVYAAMYKDEKYDPNSVIVEELFAITVVSRYTDIEFSDNLKAYNMLEENDIFDIIEATVYDVRKFRSVLDKMIDDEREKNSLVPFLSEQFEAFKLSFNEMKKAME